MGWGACAATTAKIFAAEVLTEVLAKVLTEVLAKVLAEVLAEILAQVLVKALVKVLADVPELCEPGATEHGGPLRAPLGQARN